MPPKRRVHDVVGTSRKRQKGVPLPRGTLSQPIPIESPPSSPCRSPRLSPCLSPRLSPRKALVEASQASSFEARLRETQVEEAIVPPVVGSEEATITTTNNKDTKVFKESFADDFNGIN
ncbi:hypothetical protein B0T12DRAFT_389544 [Alternaria alternata]|jgi:hypothetical protein|nr:hypothetical protein B0T12DRAFT_389544 [Alternaria alternata]